MSMQAKEQGFTLIELIVVITILGILAAFAVPRFVGLQTEARVASLNGLAGSLRSASAMVHAKALVNPTATTVSVEGGSVTLTAASGYATAGTISQALQDLSGFTANVSSNTVTFASDSTTGTCNVTYSTATTPPAVAVNSSGC